MVRSSGTLFLFMAGVFIYFDLGSGAVSSGQLHVLEDSLVLVGQEFVWVLAVCSDFANALGWVVHRTGCS